MPSLNRALLLGTLTRSPTFRQAARGTPVCTFDLQVDVAGREKACVIRVVIWGKQANSAAGAAADWGRYARWRRSATPSAPGHIGNAVL